MINKRSLWFLTLFSLILVLSVYYITMPSELLMATNGEEKQAETVSASVENEESAELVALRVESEEKMLDEIKKILTDSNSTTEEKNAAFEKMQKLNKNRGTEEQIENKIKNEFNLKSFVSIDETSVSVVIDSSKHDKELANKIMRSVQEEFETQMAISVKFQK